MLQIHQNNIRSDLPDFVPGDFAFTVLSQEAPEFLVCGSHHSQNAAVFGIEDQIRRMAQAPAVADIDDIFLAQFTEGHKNAPLFFYILCGRAAVHAASERRNSCEYHLTEKRNLYYTTFINGPSRAGARRVRETQDIQSKTGGML